MNTHFIIASVGALAGIIPLLLFIAIWFILVIGVWKVFAKGGQPGWACLIPIYNLYCLIKIAGKEWWWLLLFLVPLVNIVVAIMLVVAISKNFGKGGGFAAGLIFLPWIFYPILGFGAAQYQRLSHPATT
ncbi:MAG: DUF5684 domain-containing protein [Limisphaerales bacterium]